MITNFKRTQDSILKKYGVAIIKEGRGASASYREEKTSKLKESSVNEMKEDLRNRMKLNETYFTFVNGAFLILLGVISAPYMLFRGTREELLNFIGIKNCGYGMSLLEDALLDLVDKELVGYEEDEDLLIIYVRRWAERDLQLNSAMVEECRFIAWRHNKGDKEFWMDLLKVWVGIQLCVTGQSFSNDELILITGLKEEQLQYYKKLLAADQLFRKSKAGIYLGLAKKV